MQALCDIVCQIDRVAVSPVDRITIGRCLPILIPTMFQLLGDGIELRQVHVGVEIEEDNCLALTWVSEEVHLTMYFDPDCKNFVYVQVWYDGPIEVGEGFTPQDMGSILRSLVN